MLSGVGPGWDSSTEWSREAFRARHGEITVPVRDVSSAVKAQFGVFLVAAALVLPSTTLELP